MSRLSSPNRIGTQLGAHYELVASLGSAIAMQGELTVYPPNDLALNLRDGLDVFVVPPSLTGPRKLRISSIRNDGDTLAVGFEGITERGLAEELSGRYLLASIDDIENTEEPVEILGRHVIDERYGDLGVVSDLLVTPAHDVLVVNGSYGEVLIPCVDEDVGLPLEGSGSCIRSHVVDGLVDEHHAEEGLCS